ncbi:MAG: DUF493 domain-containing protein [Pseudomonadota bacterium]
MTDEEAPKIEFPCDYPIKVMGRSHENFRALVEDIFERHAPGYARDTIKTRTSAKGTFTSLTITITATGPDQLKALHEDLMATGQVQMVI